MANLSGVSAFSLVYTRRKIFIYLRSKQNKTRARGIICIQTLSLLLIFCTRIENLIKAMAWPIIQFLTDRISQWELQAASVTRPNKREWKQIRLVEHGPKSGRMEGCKVRINSQRFFLFCFSSNLNKYLITFWAQPTTVCEMATKVISSAHRERRKRNPQGQIWLRRAFLLASGLNFIIFHVKHEKIFRPRAFWLDSGALSEIWIEWKYHEISERFDN